MNKYTKILLLGLAVWLAETAYFGFNRMPENGIEGTLDLLSGILIGWGLLGDILTNVEIHKHTHMLDKSVNNITTKKVEVKGKPVVHYNFGTTKEETQKLLGGKRAKN